MEAVARAVPARQGASAPTGRGTFPTPAPAPRPAAESCLRRIAEGLPDVLFRFRLQPEPGFDYVSPASTAVIGYTPEELCADPDLTLRVIHPDDRHLLLGLVRAAGEIGHPVTLRWIRRNGTVLWTEVRSIPLRDERGAIAAIEGVARDVTAERALAEELRRKNEELEERSRRLEQVNETKSRFLANMSHEMRTPLAAIMGFADLMLQGKVADVPAPMMLPLERIQTSSEHLLALISDILDLAAVESGRLTFSTEQVDPQRLVTETVGTLEWLAERRRIDVRVEGDAVRAMVIDPARFKQILYNYLSNALKFTDEGGHVTVKLLREGRNRVRLEVADDGIGIRPEDLDRLFVEFEQLDGGMAKRHQGTGLGLALVKRIVEAQGGSVGVASAYGVGSTFFAVLPRIAANPSPDGGGPTKV